VITYCFNLIDNFRLLVFLGKPVRVKVNGVLPAEAGYDSYCLASGTAFSH